MWSPDKSAKLFLFPSLSRKQETSYFLQLVFNLSVCWRSVSIFSLRKKFMKTMKNRKHSKVQKKTFSLGSCPVNKFGLYNFIVYGAELSPEFLERRSVFGVVLPAVVHNPGDFHWAAVWSRHAVSWNTSQTFNISAETCLAYLFETSGIQKRF